MTDELFARLRECEGDWNPCARSQQPQISPATEHELTEMRNRRQSSEAGHVTPVQNASVAYPAAKAGIVEYLKSI